MKLPFTTITTSSAAASAAAILILLSSPIFQFAAASPQAININKPPNNLEGSGPGPERVKITVFPVGRPQQTLYFGLTRGLAIESLNMVTDIIVTRVDEAPENTHCLFWRLNDEYQSFLDRRHILAAGTVLLSPVKKAFGILCYDKTRPEMLIGYPES